MCRLPFALSPTARFPHMLGVLFVSVCGMSVWNASSATAERWTDLRGTKTIEARMVGMWDDQVILELAGGRRIAVNKGSLQAESRIQAETLASKINASRQADVDLIQRRVAEASAPAPNPLPQPPAAPEYAPPFEGMSPEDLNQHVLKQLAAGHLRVIVESMPPSHRSELDGLVASGLKKFSPDAFNAITKTLHDIGDTLVTHQRWFRSHPRFEAMSEDSAETVQTMLLSIAGFLRDGFDPQVMSLEAMQAKPFSEWIVDFDQRTSPYLAPMMASMADVEQPEMTFSEPNKDGQITVTWQVDVRNKQSVVLEQVEGYWVPLDIKKAFDEGKKKLENTPDGSVGGGSMVMLIPAMVQPYLSPLKEASSEAEFHASMETLVSQASTGLSAFSGFLPKGVGVPSLGRGSGGDPYGGDPYGDAYGPGSGYDDDSMEEDLYADPYGGAFGG